MSTLFLDRADLEIRHADGALALYENGSRSATVPTRLLERVIIQGRRTRLDSDVLMKLAEAGVATLLLSARMSRQVALVLGPAHNDAAVRLAQAQRVLDETWCQDWAHALVRAKLQHQLRLVGGALDRRPDAHKALSDAGDTLQAAGQRLDGPEALSCESLRGIEGSAARAWFSALAALLPPELEFAGRNRRPPRDPANACLSLGYTLLHFEAVRAAHVAGLDPLLGFYHRPAFGRESLACDLIEPLRPLVDEWVWQLFAERRLRGAHFSQDGKACWLGKTGRQHFHAAWAQRAALPRRWLRLRCQRLARDLRRHGIESLGPDACAAFAEEAS